MPVRRSTGDRQPTEAWRSSPGEGPPKYCSSAGLRGSWDVSQLALLRGGRHAAPRGKAAELLAMAGGRLLTGIRCEQAIQLGAIGADATVKVGGLEGPHGDRERLRGHGQGVRDAPSPGVPRAGDACAVGVAGAIPEREQKVLDCPRAIDALPGVRMPAVVEGRAREPAREALDASDHRGLQVAHDSPGSITVTTGSAWSPGPTTARSATREGRTLVVTQSSSNAMSGPPRLRPTAQRIIIRTSQSRPWTSLPARLAGGLKATHSS